MFRVLGCGWKVVRVVGFRAEGLRFVITALNPNSPVHLQA